MNALRLLFVVSLLLLVAMGPKASTGDADKQTATAAYDFSMKDLNGKTVSLGALRGKVVLLNFWATWCPPCKSEMPSMNRLYADLRGRGFEVIAVSTDSSLSVLKEFLAKNRVDFTVLYDETKTVTRQYHVFSMPTTFLIDRNGFIVEKFYGEEEWTSPEIRKKIERLL